MFYPILICTLAGLSTALGGLIVIIKGGINEGEMGFFQGLAAGVMLSISILDLLPYSCKNYMEYMPVNWAVQAVLSLAFMGWLIGALMTKLVVPEEKHREDDRIFTAKRLSVITTAVMILHNLPEGMLTMFTSTQDLSFGVKMAVAIALHNLPEGMAVASPVLYLSKSREKAFHTAFWAGMSEPIGGIGAYFLLRNVVNSGFINGLMPIIAGVMMQAALCELIPSAIKISNIKHTIYGIITGTLIMSIGIFAF
ncbi:MAG: ZIP family metal transporter [Oscillospiraceae bacterium]